MGWLGQLFGSDKKKITPEVMSAIELAVSAVEPLLKLDKGYPESFRKPVSVALDYAHSLAAQVPGPVELSSTSYAKDPLIHAMFPSHDAVMDTFYASHALQDYYQKFPGNNKLYALMGMRRVEKSVMGMELSGDTIERDVVQKMIYFSNHTLESFAPTEQQARELVALSFFDNLVNKIKLRVETRKNKKQSQLHRKDLLTSRLRAASPLERPALQAELNNMIASMQSVAGAMDLHNYLEDFEAILLSPEQHLHLNKTSFILDRMGSRHDSIKPGQHDGVFFSELVDFDRRNWTVTMVHFHKIARATFSTKLENESRKLAL